MFTRPTRTLRRLERTCRGWNPLDAVDQAIDTPPSWFDGVDVGTSWVLCWLEPASGGPPEMEAVGRLTASTTRAGYRMGRLLLRVDRHPDLGAVEQSDAVAAALFDLTSDAVCADLLSAAPACARRAVATLSELLAPRWSHELVGADGRDLRRACVLSSATGVTLAIMENHLALELSSRD
jgi:hypothetical protein